MSSGEFDLLCLKSRLLLFCLINIFLDKIWFSSTFQHPLFSICRTNNLTHFFALFCQFLHKKCSSNVVAVVLVVEDIFQCLRILESSNPWKLVVLLIREPVWPSFAWLPLMRTWLLLLRGLLQRPYSVSMVKRKSWNHRWLRSVFIYLKSPIHSAESFCHYEIVELSLNDQFALLLPRDTLKLSNFHF